MTTQTTVHTPHHLDAVDKEAIGKNLSILSRVIARLARTFTASIRASREIEELSRLSDHQLRDIGIPRHDIAHRVYAHHFPDKSNRK